MSGHSVRTIGWSDTAGRLITVITVITVTEDDVTTPVNGWASNDIDSRHYRHDREGGDHEQ